MPQPAQVTAIRDELARLYRDAQTSIDRQLSDIAAHPEDFARRRVRRERLERLAAEVRRLADQLDHHAGMWLSTRFPLVYEHGAAAAAVDTGRPFQWTQTHVDAVTELAADTHADLLKSTRYMRRDVKTAIRSLSRAAARSSLVEGETARQAGRQLARTLTERGINAVRYKNGTTIGIGPYAEMVVRTKTGQAFNAGTLNHLQAGGVAWVEVFDGADCGWTSHADSDLANGTVRTLDDARAHPLAHPRCARSFAGRPDLTTREEAAAARRLSAPDQQREADAERARAREAARRRRAASRRRARTSRQRTR